MFCFVVVGVFFRACYGLRWFAIVCYCVLLCAIVCYCVLRFVRCMRERPSTRDGRRSVLFDLLICVVVLAVWIKV
jgi:hypothetical protein